MFEYIKGKIISISPTAAILENSGIGYHIQVSLNTFTSIKDKKDTCLYTYAVIRNESQATSSYALYGFFDKNERKLFLHLISVSGVGNNTALLILSSLGPAELITVIGGGDTASMQKIKGIGAKTAQRIIVDLQDKIGKISDIKIPAFEGNTVQSESLSALLTLGFNRISAEKAVNKVISTSNEQSVEQVIKQALSHLAS